MHVFIANAFKVWIETSEEKSRSKRIYIKLVMNHDWWITNENGGDTPTLSASETGGKKWT